MELDFLSQPSEYLSDGPSDLWRVRVAKAETTRCSARKISVSLKISEDDCIEIFFVVDFDQAVSNLSGHLMGVRLVLCMCRVAYSCVVNRYFYLDSILTSELISCL